MLFRSVKWPATRRRRLAPRRRLRLRVSRMLLRQLRRLLLLPSPTLLPVRLVSLSLSLLALMSRCADVVTGGKGTYFYVCQSDATVETRWLTRSFAAKRRRWKLRQGPLRVVQGHRHRPRALRQRGELLEDGGGHPRRYWSHGRCSGRRQLPHLRELELP